MSRYVRNGLRGNILACALASICLASPPEQGDSRHRGAVRKALALPFLQTMRTGAYGNGEKKRYETVRVYYGTDRATESTRYSRPPDPNYVSPALYYGSQRTQNGVTQFGYCDIAVPYDRKLGSLYSSSWLRFLNAKSPEFWVTVLGVKGMDEFSFFDLAKREVKKQPSKEIFVFIHGYHTSFEDAARRTGQLAYDLKFPGLAFFFSWPSQAEYVAYPADENAVEWAIPHLEQFLPSRF